MAVIGTSGLLAPGRLGWLRALCWMVALTVLLIVSFNAIVGATQGLIDLASGSDLTTRSVAPAADRLVAAIAGSVAVLAVYWAAVRIAERRPVEELGLRRLPIELLLGCAVGAALMAAIVAVLWVSGWIVVEPRPVEAVALALRDSIRSGVVEEVVLRLVIFRLLWRAFGIWPALAGSALLFGALHLSNPESGLWAAFCLICGEGVVIGLYLITGRIWASIGMHAAWNFTQGWVFGAAVSGTSQIAGGPLESRPAEGVAEMLSGGGFGPEASFAALVVSLLASAAFLLGVWKSGRFVADDVRRA